MFNGWVVRSQEGRVLHVREALLPDPVGEEVALELQELEKPPLEFEEPPKRRIHGKQRPVDMPRIMIPPSPDNLHRSPVVDDADYSPTTVADADDSPRLFSLGPKMLFGGETLGKDNEMGMETEKSRYINTSDLIQRNKVKENGGEVGMETEKSRYINTSDLIQRNKVKENGEVETETETKETQTKTGKETETENGGKKEVVRLCKIEELEKIWSLFHQGVVNELGETLKLVPLDENEGKEFGESGSRIARK